MSGNVSPSLICICERTASRWRGAACLTYTVQANRLIGRKLISCIGPLPLACAIWNDAEEIVASTMSLALTQVNRALRALDVRSNKIGCHINNPHAQCRWMLIPGLRSFTVRVSVDGSHLRCRQLRKQMGNHKSQIRVLSSYPIEHTRGKAAVCWNIVVQIRASGYVFGRRESPLSASTAKKTGGCWRLPAVL